MSEFYAADFCQSDHLMQCINSSQDGDSECGGSSIHLEYLVPTLFTNSPQLTGNWIDREG